MTRRFTPHGQRHGSADARTGYQQSRRDDGARFERAADSPARWPTILAIVVMVAMLVIVTNGDLIVRALLP